MAGIDPISNVASAAAKIISLFKLDPAVKAAGQIQLDEEALRGGIQEQLAQIQANAAEAGSKSAFVAGWRPFIGWVCGAALGYTFVMQPFLQFALVAFHSHFDPAALPKLSLGDLMPILLGLLGLGAMRTYEKVQGAAPGMN